MINIKSCDRDSWEHALNYSQYIVSDTNKQFKFDLDWKQNLWLKFEPNFLTRLPNGKIKKTTVYQLFSLLIQFSAIETRWVFFHAKLMTSWLPRLERKVGCWCSLLSYSQFFQLAELSIKANLPCLQYARARGRENWRRHKLCAERMCDANVRNHLNRIGRLIEMYQIVI